MLWADRGGISLLWEGTGDAEEVLRATPIAVGGTLLYSEL